MGSRLVDFPVRSHPGTQKAHLLSWFNATIPHADCAAFELCHEAEDESAQQASLRPI
jgi:hypothetical protein